MEMSTEYKKLLILCIDRDNDIGEKLGIPTPIIGRDNILNVAIQYILRYPDDSDANAMFSAVQLYDSLVSSLGKDNVEIALVTGSSSEDYTADLKLLSEVDQVLRKFNPDAFIVVSDSPSDEAIITLLQSRKPVVSVKRVIVRQARGFEDFAVLAKYYFLKLLTESRYRRYVLGIPGALILFYGIWLIIPDYVKVIISPILTLLIGFVLVMFAFNLHEQLLRILRRYELTFFMSIIAVAIAIAYPLTNLYVFNTSISQLFSTRPTPLDILGLAIGLILTSNILEVYVKKGVIYYSRVFILTLTTLFPVLVINSLYWYIMGILSFTYLVINILLYFTINVLTLTIVNYIKKRGA